MAKVKYYAKENSTIGTHSFYAVPIPNGTLTFDELLEEAMDGKRRQEPTGLHRSRQVGFPLRAAELNLQPQVL